MGADIHMYVEYNRKDRLPHANDAFKSWSWYGGRINPGRDYNMFALLAGVRDYENVGPVFTLRGVPQEISWPAEMDNTLYISEEFGEDDGYCTLEQALSYEKYGSVIEYRDGKPWRVSHPDWHSHTWLTVDEFSTVLGTYETKFGCPPGVEYRAMLACMRALEDGGKNDVRVVLWFDN